MPILMFVAWLAFITALPSLAWSEDDPLHIGHTHEGAVGKFYQTWNTPPNRTMSCCNKEDCRPILEMKRAGVHGATWQVLLNVGDGRLQWYPVYDDVWEDAQTDPRESPDGRGHACVYYGEVRCAVRAAGL